MWDFLQKMLINSKKGKSTAGKQPATLRIDYTRIGRVPGGAARLNEVSESDSDATDKVTDWTREEIPEADSNEGTSGLSA